MIIMPMEPFQLVVDMEAPGQGSKIQFRLDTMVGSSHGRGDIALLMDIPKVVEIGP